MSRSVENIPSLRIDSQLNINEIKTFRTKYFFLFVDNIQQRKNKSPTGKEPFVIYGHIHKTLTMIVWVLKQRTKRKFGLRKKRAVKQQKKNVYNWERKLQVPKISWAFIFWRPHSITHRVCSSKGRQKNKYNWQYHWNGKKLSRTKINW